MKTRYSLLIALVLVVTTSALAFGDTLISKPPDLGLYWQPLGNTGSGNTPVYADGFYAPGGDDQVSALGTWLSKMSEGGSTVLRFEVWGTSDATGGPDCNNVIAATDEFTSEVVGELALVTMPVTSGGGPLVEGVLYWFVATGANLGSPSNVPYQTGGHTQNSVYNDNATFWFSNADDGCNFDGQNFTPEMAFEVLLTGPVGTEQATWSSMKALYR